MAAGPRTFSITAKSSHNGVEEVGRCERKMDQFIIRYQYRRYGTRRSNHWGGGNTIDVQDSRSKSTLALEDVEVAATKLRSCSTEYVNSLSCYRFALEHFWIREECLLNSELAQVGCQLSSQLILQFEWDMKMAHAILIFLDDELYNKCNHRIVNSRIGAIASNNDATRQIILGLCRERGV